MTSLQNLNNGLRRPASLSVSQVTTRIKSLLENEFLEVWLHGEVSGLRPAASGHWYFSLKDKTAVINCALFRNNQLNLRTKISDGMEVLVHGKLSVYAPRGSYQLIIDFMEPVGAGALQIEFNKLKDKLLNEGLFDESRKRLIPKFPRHVAIVTSPTGAAIRDVISVFRRRGHLFDVLVVPAVVQGREAVPSILNALNTIYNSENIDLILVTRGGGSIEDLWCFNDEQVVRTLSQSPVPTISAIGHEVDFTLTDFVADLRAATPSAAAEILTHSRVDLIDRLEGFDRYLVSLTSKLITEFRNKLRTVERRLVSPVVRVSQSRAVLRSYLSKLINLLKSRPTQDMQLIDDLLDNAERCMIRALDARKLRYSNLTTQLDALSPLKVLSRGYTLVSEHTNTTTMDRVFIKSVNQVKSRQQLMLQFHDGRVHAQVTEVLPTVNTAT